MDETKKKRRGKRGGAKAKDGKDEPAKIASDHAGVSAVVGNGDDEGVSFSTDMPVTIMPHGSKEDAGQSGAADEIEGAVKSEGRKNRRGKRAGAKANERTQSSKVHEESNHYGQNDAWKGSSNDYGYGDNWKGSSNGNDFGYGGGNRGNGYSQGYSGARNNYNGESRSSFAAENQPDFGLVPPDSVQYFENVEKMIDANEWGSDEEFELFMENVFREVSELNIKVAGDPLCSRIVEKIIRHASDAQLLELAVGFRNMYADMFRHRFASHVVQALLMLASKVVDREVEASSAKKGDEEKETMESFLMSLCEELKDQWTSLMIDPWGSHVVRTLLLVFSGQSLEDNDLIRSKRSKTYKSNHQIALKEYTKAKAKPNELRPTPLSFKKNLDSITNAIINSLHNYDLREYALSDVSSPVFQILLGTKGVGEKMFSKFQDLNSESAGSSLCVRSDIRKAAPAEAFHEMYVNHFRSKIQALCYDGIGNFMVQHLILNTRNGIQLEVLLDEILPIVEDLIFNNRAGVIIKCLEACSRHKACQKEMFKAICSAFHASEPSERIHLVKLMLFMRRRQHFNAKEPLPFQYQGALIIESLMSFGEDLNSVILNSFLTIESSELLTWMRDPIASRVFETFVESQHVSLKAKRKILSNLLGRFSEMASDRYGSHIVDKCWAAADITMKEKIATELLNDEKALAANYHGKFVLRNCKIETFKKSKEMWAENQMGIERKKAMFEEFLTNDVAPKKQTSDPLWTTNKYDKTMEALGVDSSSNTVARTKSSKPSKKGHKKKTDAGDHLKIEADGDDIPDVDSITVKPKLNEIDAVFRTKSKKKGAAKQEIMEKNSHDDGEDSDDDQMEGVEQREQTMDESLADVLDALSATKKKRKSTGSKSKPDSKTDSKTKRRKFES
ncbi:Nucleolar protein 9 [Dinochytrium kinnereticum]|nr:Nucleolar protein 9 [Dinochytrium kinnereticum]